MKQQSLLGFFTAKRSADTQPTGSSADDTIAPPSRKRLKEDMSTHHDVGEQGGSATAAVVANASVEEKPTQDGARSTTPRVCCHDPTHHLMFSSHEV